MSVGRAMRTLAVLLRLLLGGLLIFAGITKLLPPEHRLLFEMAVSAHRMLPPEAVIWVAWLIPLVEILLGGLLIAGWKTRWIGALVAVLLSFFLSLMYSAYFRGIQGYCGCFGFGEPIGPWTLVRDTGLFVVAVFVAVAAWLQRRRKTSHLARLSESRVGGSL